MTPTIEIATRDRDLVDLAVRELSDAGKESRLGRKRPGRQAGSRVSALVLVSNRERRGVHAPLLLGISN